MESIWFQFVTVLSFSASKKPTAWPSLRSKYGPEGHRCFGSSIPVTDSKARFAVSRSPMLS